MQRKALREIQLKGIRKPLEESINAKIQWLGESLGLFSSRDKDSSCYRIFIELVKSAKLQKPLSSDELAYRLQLTRGTVIHHMNKLMQAGIVVKINKRYQLRQPTIALLVQELKKDAERILEDLEAVGKAIDEHIFK